MEKTVFAHKGQYERELEHHNQHFLDGEFAYRCREFIMHLDATYAYSAEPVPFEEIGALEFKPIKVGEVWARENFACAWFHITGKLPAEVDRTNLYFDFSNDGEGLLVDKNGHALKGFTCGSPIFNLINRMAEKRYYPLEEIMDEDGNIDVYIDGASNGILGEFKDTATLVAAGIVREIPQMIELFWDCDVLQEYCWALPFSDDKKEKILYGIRKVENLIMYNDPDYYEKGKAVTKELLSLAGFDNLQVTAVGHAHLDLAWLWPIRESKRKAKRTFANAIYLLKRYPTFHFVVPQPQQLAWMKELDPQLFEELKAFAKEGRLEPVGGGWVENDTNVPCEEALVRQELYGQKFWQEEFGDYVRLRWLPDTFGYSGAFPQILKLSKQDYFMTIKISWSNRTLFPYHTFHWAGIDGSDVLVHMPPEGTYNSSASPRHGLYGAKGQLREADQKEKFLMIYGIGDGGGGPSAGMIERLNRLENVPYLPKVKQGSAHKFFESLDGMTLPRYQGEMYLEKHRATYTSQSNNKNKNRDSESKLIAYEALLAALGQKGNKAVIDDIWKEVLLYQFHDILPGSSIQRVYDETEVAYAEIAEKMEKLVNEYGVSFIPAADKSLVNMDNRAITKIAKAGDKYLYFKGADKLLAPTVYANAKESNAVDFVETDYYAITFDADGSFKSIVLKENGELALSNANKLRVFIDKGDSWDFPDDYRDQPEQFMSLTDTLVRDFGDLLEVTQKYGYKNSKLTQTIVIHKHEPLIQIHHDVNWVDAGYMVRAEFLPATWADTVRSDIQFGYLDRPTTDDTEHDFAQFEMCCQKWFDISDEEKKQGFAILNNTKCGFMAKQGIVSLNLVRSTEYPSIERDHVSYSYALYPHTGGFDPVALDDMAKDYNARSLYGDKALAMPSTDNAQVEITAFKPAYNGDGFIVRMFERTGKPATTKLSLPNGYALVCETDLLEDKMGEAADVLEFKPFQIRTFKVKRV